MNMNFSNISKQILTALGATTVSFGAAFSLFLAPAQAASFTTTFTTTEGDVTLTWSGEDATDDTDNLITFDELYGEMTLVWDGTTYELGDVDDPDRYHHRSFTYNLDLGQIDLDTLNVGDVVDYTNVFDVNFYATSDNRIRIELNAAVAGKNHVYISQETIKANPGAGTETTVVAATPEPSLTLGFITLSGLMLGGTRKIRKAKAEKV